MPIRYNQDGSPTHGTFDISHTLTRERWENGIIKNVISKMWIETDDEYHFNRLQPWMQLPWGTYPDIPDRKK